LFIRATLFSTSDVFDGLCAGLTMNDVEVVPFQWERPLQTLGAIVGGAIGAGVVKPEKAEKVRQFTSWLAAADAISIAVDSEVDAVLVVNGILFPADRAQVMHKLNIPVACYGTEAPYFLDKEQEIAPFYSHWFTNERRCVGMFGDVPTFYLPHAYNPEVHVPGPVHSEKACDVVFIGGGYPERKTLLNGVDWRGISLATRGTLWHLDLVAERNATDIGRASRYSEGAIPNTETAAWHRSAAISLNLHRRMTYVETGATIPAGTAESLGPRAYEIPAVGGFMLCDDERPELWDVYGESAATFRAWNSADLERQIRYWLSHPNERERTRQAQAEAARPHHWGNRAKYVLETIFA
jgi:spore maturation protein CgeB